MDEFALIRKYFSELTPQRSDVALGIGDDCALLRPPAGEDLAVSTDTLVAGRHFPEHTAPADIGWKALAVNLSDLAAMGGQPRWFTLALTLPSADETWLREFSGGLRALALKHDIALIGGDTTRGALSITITVLGSVPAGLALRRSGAQPGDAICVTGTLGDAALALRLGARAESALRERLDRPQPRVEAGRAARGLAHAAIDLSDGLAGDLEHVLSASAIGADVHLEHLPASDAFARCAPPADRTALQLAGGDDYELCLCIPPEVLPECRRRVALPLTQIGVITQRRGLRFLDAQGRVLTPQFQGFQHF